MKASFLFSIYYILLACGLIHCICMRTINLLFFCLTQCMFLFKCFGFCEYVCVCNKCIYIYIYAISVCLMLY